MGRYVSLYNTWKWCTWMRYGRVGDGNTASTYSPLHAWSVMQRTRLRGVFHTMRLVNVPPLLDEYTGLEYLHNLCRRCYWSRCYLAILYDIEAVIGNNITIYLFLNIRTSTMLVIYKSVVLGVRIGIAWLPATSIAVWGRGWGWGKNMVFRPNIFNNFHCGNWAKLILPSNWSGLRFCRPLYKIVPAARSTIVILLSFSHR